MDTEQRYYETFNEFRRALIVTREHIRAGTDEPSLLLREHQQLTTGHGRGGVPQLRAAFVRDLEQSLAAEGGKKHRSVAVQRFRDVERAMRELQTVREDFAEIVRHFMSHSRERDLSNYAQAYRWGLEESTLFEWREKAVLRLWRIYCRQMALADIPSHTE